MDILEKLTQVKVGDFTLGKLVAAVALALVCLLVIRLVTRLVRRLLSGTRLDERIQRCILGAMKLLLYIVSVLIVVDSLGIPVTSLVALLSVGSLGITLAAEDILGNVAGGLVLLASRPFVLGDFIETSSISGTVMEISLNHTKVRTPDGLLVMLPNRELASSRMTNYTTLGCARVCQVVTASYDAPTETVKAACRMALDMTEDVLEDPAPAIYLTEYGASAISYTVYCWAPSDKLFAVRMALGENLRAGFDHYHVEMTYDHLNVHIVDQPKG